MAHDDDRGPERDWVDRLADLAALLGFNRVRVRWKLDRWRQNQAERRLRAGQRVAQIGYEHKVCPRCGRVNDRSEKVCDRCGEALGARAFHLLRRIGLSLPAALSVSSILGLMMVVAYARLVLAEGGPQAIFSFSVDTLYRFGGHFPPAVWAGDWWRLGTSIFLHLGLWHLGFNLFALSQIGPQIEELFGRGRMLLFFLLTGVMANLGSEALGLRGVAIGASGAIMGLCGLAAGWGQRDGTSIGRATRNLMLKWGLYTLVFGYLIGADNGAHLSGLVAGFVIGFLSAPGLLRKTERMWLQIGQTVLGALACLGLFLLVLVPPSPALTNPFGTGSGDMLAGENPYGVLIEVCDLLHSGQRAEALARWRAAYGKYDTRDDVPALGADDLKPACESLDQMRENCRKYRKDGLEAVYPPGMVPVDEYQRVQLERGLRSQCGWLKE